MSIPDLESATRQKPRFQIRHLFWLTFFAAVLAASAKTVGIVVIMAMVAIGYFLAPVFVFLLICLLPVLRLPTRLIVGILMLGSTLVVMVSIGARNGGKESAFGIAVGTTVLWMVQAIGIATVYAVWRSGIRASQHTHLTDLAHQDQSHHDLSR